MLEFFRRLLQALRPRARVDQTAPEIAPTGEPAPAAAVEPEVLPIPIAWGARLSLAFREALIAMCLRLAVKPDEMTACIAFETGLKFSPAVRNAAGSGAVGLIQFMPSTAVRLGTSVVALASMTAVEQLHYVELYFMPYARRLNNLGDVYMAILWPAAIGKLDDHVLFEDSPTARQRYLQNIGLDANQDRKVTRGEASARVAALLVEGLKPENRA